jgi:hypothetical protein
MHMARRHYHPFGNFNLACGAFQNAAGSSRDVAAHSDDGLYPQNETVAYGNFDLRRPAHRAENPHFAERAFRADYFHRLVAGELAWLGEAAVIGERGVFSEQRFKVILRKVDMAGRDGDRKIEKPALCEIRKNRIPDETLDLFPLEIRHRTILD